MNKLICAMLAAILALSLAACNSSAETETGTPTTEAAGETTTGTTAPDASEEAFKTQVLADNEDVTFTVTGVDAENIWGYTLNVFIENKTDKTLMFSVDSVSVNGFMCDPFWACEVAPGMKANEEISFSESDFEKNGIETVTEITFTLRVYDSNDWTDSDILNKTFTIQL